MNDYNIRYDRRFVAIRLRQMAAECSGMSDHYRTALKGRERNALMRLWEKLKEVADKIEEEKP